jgi:hypothetical protein
VEIEMKKTLLKIAMLSTAVFMLQANATDTKPATEPKNKPFTKVVVKKSDKKAIKRKVDKCETLKGAKKAACKEKRD